MAELDPVPDLDQPPGLSGGRCGCGESQLRPGPPEQVRIPGGIGRRGQQQGLGVRGQSPDFLEVALPELASERQRLGQRCAASQLAGLQRLADLDEGQRVPPGLGHNALADRLFQPGFFRPGSVPPRAVRSWPVPARAGGGRQQLSRRSLIQASQPQLGQAFQECRPGSGFPHGEDHHDGVGVQAAGQERQGGGRLVIQPVRVVDQAEQRLGRGAGGQQPQRREPDQEAVGRRTVLQPEGQPERGALRRRKLTGRGQARPEQLVQGGEAELHLALNPADPGNLEVRGGGRQVVQQRGLADPRLAPENERAAQPSTGRTHELVQPFTFDGPPYQPLHGFTLTAGSLRPGHPAGRRASPWRFGRHFAGRQAPAPAVRALPGGAGHRAPGT